VGGEVEMEVRTDERFRVLRKPFVERQQQHNGGQHTTTQQHNTRPHLKNPLLTSALLAQNLVHDMKAQYMEGVEVKVGER
jgi:hypothetical protein